MGAQAKLNIDTTPFVLYEYPGSRVDNATIVGDAGRTGDIAPFTLMAKIAATGKWTPFTNEALTTGAGLPAGIFVPSELQGAITEAEVIAGDVVDVPIIQMGIKFDATKLIIENSKTLDTILGVGTVDARTIYDELVKKTLIPVNARSASLPQEG